MPPRLLSLLLALTLPALAEPTTSYVNDTTRALDDTTQLALEQELTQFHRDTGVLLTVQAVSYLDPGVTMRTAARQARLATASSGPVAIIMVDRGKNGLGISHSPELWQRYPLPDMVEVLRHSLSEASDDTLPGQEKLLATARLWMTEVRALESQRQLSLAPFQKKETPLLLGFLSILALGGITGLRLATQKRFLVGLQNQRFHFPDIVIGQRLGAPHGARVILPEEP
jgi:hypothetical protein